MRDSDATLMEARKTWQRTSSVQDARIRGEYGV